MVTLYLMRHGQTLFNAMNLEQGQCDSPLTKQGIQQALKAREWYLSNEVHFDAVYSSTSERACDTAELVANMPYQRVKGLKEIFLGTKEATPCGESPTWPYGDYFVKFGGEDLDAFRNRFYGAIKEIADRHDNETILIVSHGMAIKEFLWAMKYPNLDSFIMGNCGIVKLEYDHNQFTVKQIINPNQ